jgi:protein-disulfide isomerase
LAQEVDLSEVGHARGEADAPIAVVEFGDFACGACAQFHDTTWPALDRDYVQTGRIVWRHVPFVLGFRRGDDATKAGECAAVQGEYWGMHDRLFGQQNEWKEGRKHKEVFFRYAQELGLDAEAFRECYDKNRGKDRTKQANRAAKDLGVRATPTFFIDGFRVQGALSVEAFAALLEEAAARREANGS